MARRENELFIGAEHLNDEGRMIKHPALIKYYATPNSKKIRDELIPLVGIDIETEASTGSPRLLGYWDGKEYQYTNSDFLSFLFAIVRNANRKDGAIAYWNRLDPFVIFRMFLEATPEDLQREALDRFGKISGDWNRKLQRWDISPVIYVRIGKYQFGIIQAIRSSIQFFYKHQDFSTLKKVWAYDIAVHYQGGLTDEAARRLEYYSKIDESAHIVDWERYGKDDHYKHDIVLMSNKLDSMAAHDLGMLVQSEFKKAFGAYPRTLISAGSLARSAVVATLFNDYAALDEDVRNRKVADDVGSIGIVKHLDEWLKQVDQDTVKDAYALMTEAYSGGYIDAFMYGFTPSAYYADIASAYPGIIQHLRDLRGSKLTAGKGDPPDIPNSYTLIRGVLNVPEGVNFHPVTVKHPIHHETNIRAVGQYRASYTLNERRFMEKQGVTFTDENWINVETLGELSPLARICMSFVDLRSRLKAAGDTSEQRAKDAANSLYGVLYEAVDTYEETTVKKSFNESIRDTTFKEALGYYRKKINLDSVMDDLKYYLGSDARKLRTMWHNPDGAYPDQVAEELKEDGIDLGIDQPADIVMEINRLYRLSSTISHEVEYKEKAVLRSGFRAGEFWNPLYAAIITSETRIKIAEAATEISKAGGQVILAMTDALFWTGSAEMMPADLVREKKTLGYFERPKHVNDMVCLGSGRYQYMDDSGLIQAKRRGLNAASINDPDGIDMTDINWLDVLRIMHQTRSDKIEIKTRTLISPGLVLHHGDYRIEDLGKVSDDESKEIDVIVGINKRYYENDIKRPDRLMKGLVNTHPLKLLPGMTGSGEIDQTLPRLREMMQSKDMLPKAVKRRVSDRKRKAKSRTDTSVKDHRNGKYNAARQAGYTRTEARRMMDWSDDRLDELLRP